MSVSADTLKLLIDAGVSGDALVAIVRSIEADNGPAQTSGAERQRRYRERLKSADVTDSDVTDDVTRDVTTVTVTPPPAPSLDKEKGTQKEINPTPTHPRENTPARKAGFVLPSHIPAEPWAGFEEMRRKIGKPMTDRARALAVGELDKLAQDGWPPGEVLNHCTMNSYQGIFPPKGQKNGYQSPNDRRSQSDVIRDPVLADLARRSGMG